MKVFTYLAVGIGIASSLLADSLPQPKINTEGWALFRGEVVTDQQDESFVRLALKVNRGKSDLNTTVPLDMEHDYELKIVYKSDNTTSTRDKGSWIFIAFRDAQDKQIAEQCRFFEQSSTWKNKSIPFKAPAGAAKCYMSIRQQQSQGILDIQSVELLKVNADATTTVIKTLSPGAKSALAWIRTPGEKLSPEGESAPLDGNIFQPYLKGKAPVIVRDLGTETIDKVLVRKVIWRSMTVGGINQDVYAIIARPSTEGKFPGILWLHGGNGCAEISSAVRYAKAGYVAIAPDLPGIGSPKTCTNSTGPWTSRASMLGMMGKPDSTASGMFDAVVAALQAFDLLASQPDVMKDRIGVSGISMGGYTTTMISGLLGERVKAAYSKFGCGFYDRGSTWTKELEDLPNDQREAWLHHFDAGRRASGIRAPYFIAAAASDHYFWPPAVNATLLEAHRFSNQVFAPANHRLTGIPNEESLDLFYFGYWLKNEGHPFPKVTIDSYQAQSDGSRQINFSVQAALPVRTATVYVTAGGMSWEQSAWEPIAAQNVGESRFQAIIPSDKFNKQGAWFVNVSDARPVTAGSFVYGMDISSTGPQLHPLGMAPLK